jgi:hypothetical protein
MNRRENSSSIFAPARIGSGVLDDGISFEAAFF